MIRIIDDQNAGFFDGQEFANNAEVIKALANLHSNDWNGENSKNEPITIFEFLKPLSEEEQLKFLLDYGGWSVEQVPGHNLEQYEIVFNCLIMADSRKQAKQIARELEKQMPHVEHRSIQWTAINHKPEEK